MTRKGMIYNLEKGKIEVYSIRPIEHKFKLYRVKELDKFLPLERVLIRENTRSWFTPTKGVVYECENYILRPMKYAKKEQQRDAIRTLRDYMDGSFRRDPVRVYENGLITLSPNNDTTNKCIQLSEEAYYAYLLDNEDFTSTYLQEADLEDLREVFRLSKNPITEITTDELKRLYLSGLAEGRYDEKMDYIEKTSKVFKKIR